MVYVPINPDLFTAAFSGMYAGIIGSRSTVSSTAADYSLEASVAGAFAEEIDTVYNNAAPLTATQCGGVSALCEQYYGGRFPPGTVSQLTIPTYFATDVGIILAMLAEGEALLAVIAPGALIPCAGDPVYVQDNAVMTQPTNIKRSPALVDSQPIDNTAQGVTSHGLDTSGLALPIGGDFATVAGGDQNTIPVTAGAYDTIGGGVQNSIDLIDRATIGGGQLNTVAGLGTGGTVAGGIGNTVTQVRGTIGGGTGNNVVTNSDGTIGGGTTNTVTGQEATVGGGGNNAAGGLDATIGGGGGNTTVGDDATVGGGNTNTATGNGSTIGGGAGNHTVGLSSTIGGGADNTAPGNTSTVGGGQENTSVGVSSTVAGGTNNTAANNGGTVGGGNTNTAAGVNGTVAGGSNNNTTAAGGFVGGGDSNVAGNNAVAAGGSDNHASGAGSAIGGGNTNTASGIDATVPGGNNNLASGDYSLARGSSASATRKFQDSQGGSLSTQGFLQVDDLISYGTTPGVGVGETTNLKVGGPTGTEITLENGMTYNVDIRWNASSVNGAARGGGRITALVKCEAGAVTIINQASPADEQFAEAGAVTWTMTLSASAALMRLQFSTGTTTAATVPGAKISWLQVNRGLT